MNLQTYLTNRAAPSLKFRCGCCDDVLDRADHMGDAFTEDHSMLVRTAYGFDVCFGCADSFVPETGCDYCHLSPCNCDDAADQARADEMTGVFDG